MAEIPGYFTRDLFPTPPLSIRLLSLHPLPTTPYPTYHSIPSLPLLPLPYLPIFSFSFNLSFLYCIPVQYSTLYKCFSNSELKVIISNFSLHICLTLVTYADADWQSAFRLLGPAITGSNPYTTYHNDPSVYSYLQDHCKAIFFKIFKSFPYSVLHLNIYT